MTTKIIPVSIYAEMTPNPSTMKFVANRLIIENGGVVEYNDPDETKNSPLAARLFNFPFVTALFISGNFITITKNDIIEWDDVMTELREYIQEYLNSGSPVFNAPVDPAITLNKEDVSFENTMPETEIEKQIVSVLEEYVKPAVERDGGAIHFKSFKEGVVSVVLRGSCSGCPSSSITLKNGIEALMTRMVPEVKEVVAYEG